MRDTACVRDDIIRLLRGEKNYSGMVSIEIDGYFFSAAEVALPDNEGNCEVFRIAVISYQKQE